MKSEEGTGKHTGR